MDAFATFGKAADSTGFKNANTWKKREKTYTGLIPELGKLGQVVQKLGHAHCGVYRKVLCAVKNVLKALNRARSARNVFRSLGEWGSFWFCEGRACFWGLLDVCVYVRGGGGVEGATGIQVEALTTVHRKSQLERFGLDQFQLGSSVF